MISPLFNGHAASAAPPQQVLGTLAQATLPLNGIALIWGYGQFRG